MKKWILGIAAHLVLVAALGFAAFIWLAMATGLQTMVLDNLTSLKRQVILDDRALGFSYGSYGVEVKGFLQPTLTLSRVQVTLQDGATQYRLNADELSFLGSFTQLQDVALRAPQQVQLTINTDGKPPRNLMLSLPQQPQLHLLTSGAESPAWENYAAPKIQQGVVSVTDDATGRKAEVKYTLPPVQANTIRPPFSRALLPVLKRFAASVGANE